MILSFLVFILGIQCLYLITYNIKKYETLCNAPIIFNTFTLFDFCLSSFFSILIGDVSTASYQDHLYLIDLEIPIIIQILFLFTIQITYDFFPCNYFKNTIKGKPNKNLVKVGYLIWFLTVPVALVTILLEIRTVGGFNDWLEFKSAYRWVQTQQGVESQLTSLKIIPYKPLCLFGMYLILLNSKSRQLLKILIIFVTLLIVSTDFYRGSILLFVIITVLSLRDFKPSNNLAPLLFKYGFICITVFSIFGMLRDNLANKLWLVEETNLTEYLVKVGNQGSGLKSLGHILVYYSNAEYRLDGSSIVNSLLLPVPRIIYKSKPEWYGVAEITRSMGWPKTTQDAVTIPGELYANFGIAGFLLTPFYGIIFKFLDNFQYSKSKIRVPIYCAVIVYGILVSFWMSTIALMNMFIQFVLVYSISQLCEKQFKK